jgi:hypothetical protein
MIGSLFAATLRIDDRKHNLQISRDHFPFSLLEGVKADPQQEPERFGPVRIEAKSIAIDYELEEQQQRAVHAGWKSGREFVEGNLRASDP